MAMDYENLGAQQYELYLSTFGKKVLRTLVENLATRNECNKIQVRSGYTYGQNKRVLHFDDSHIPSSIIACRQNLFVNESHNICENKSPIKNTKDVDSSIVTASQGLLKTVVVGDVSEKVDACIDIKNDTNHQSGKGVTEIEENSDWRVSDDNLTVPDHTQWDDIFDTQLLNDLTALDTESKLNIQQDNVNKSDSFQPYTECEKDLSPSNINKQVETLHMTKYINADYRIQLHLATTAQKTEEIPSDNVDLKKRKVKRRSSYKITNVVPKKVKYPSADPKNTFRKQKYTEAVKTWLVQNEDMQPEPEIMKPEEKKTNTKTVQAQLTNKGGIMKFGKPKQTGLTETQTNIEIIKNTVHNTSFTAKGKPARSKFVPPVKSQIPVKNILYEIIHLNDDFKKREAELNAIHDTEINMVLTLSNGFCQLDHRSATDTCVVEGIIFQINDLCYYWHHHQKSFCDTMEKVINHNTLVCYDGKNVLKYLTSQCDINIACTEVKVLDLQIGGYLLDPSSPPGKFSDLQKLLALVPEFTVGGECRLHKAAWYLSLLNECFGKLRALLLENELWNVFVEIEMPVLPIVAEMERRGVCVDTDRLRAMEERLVRRLRATERACHAAAGRAFQVNSAPQVRSILYDELQLDVRANVHVRETLTKGDKSTSETMLRSLMAVHPLPRLILEYRHLHKAHATFVAGITHHVEDGVVRPTWELTSAVTGRLACSNPNLQAIPKGPFSLVLFPADTTEEELLTDREDTMNFRSVYVARAGHVLVAADFRHIECRVFASAAADSELRAALASPDLFTVLAAKWLNKAECEVSACERERTKRVVYAGVYGAGARTLADILRLPYERTLTVLASFNRTFPALKSFGRGVVAQCERRAGRLTTLCGRGRTFANIFSGDCALKAQAERQAVNFIVQGTAADLCKRAMWTAARRLRAAPLLQIHDELVWEVRPEDLPRAAAEIKSVMEGIGEACGLVLPLPVALSTGPSWGAMEEYILDSSPYTGAS